MLSVDVPQGSSFQNAAPREVLRGDWFSDLYGDQSWDVAHDGRFLSRYVRTLPVLCNYILSDILWHECNPWTSGAGSVDPGRTGASRRHVAADNRCV